VSAPSFDIHYIAHLARLSLTPEEERQAAAQLGHVLDYIEKLKEVDVTGVEPTAHPFPLTNVVRGDAVSPSLATQEALRNAPSEENGLILVPKIVE